MAMPTDNGKSFFIKDFYKRTLENYKSYDGDYDVTLLINSLLGMLVVPKEKYFNSKHIDDTFIDEKILQQLRESVTKYQINGADCDTPFLELHQIIRHMRNSIAHGNMTIIGEKNSVTNKPVQITRIQFNCKYQEKSTKTNVSFYIDLKIELLKNFIFDFIKNVIGEK